MAAQVTARRPGGGAWQLPRRLVIRLPLGCAGTTIRPKMARRARKYYTFEIVVEKEPRGPGYSAYSPTLPGCFSNGKTIAEAKRNMRDAVRAHVETLLSLRQPVPQRENLVQVEELTLAIG